MHLMWRLATRNWSTSPARSLAAVLSVALGVAAVTIITSFYETARRAITEQVVNRWLGAAHLTVYPTGAHWGTLDASLAEVIARLDNVRHVTTRLTRRMRLLAPQPQPGDADEAPWSWVDAIGIDPATEASFRSLTGLEGRLPASGEQGAAVVERDADRSISLGDRVILTRYQGGPRLELTIVGLCESQRIAEFQRPVVYLAIEDLRRFLGQMGQASAIDVMLRDPAPAKLAAAESGIAKLLKQRDAANRYNIESAAGRQMLLSEADRTTRLLLMLVSFVAMLTSFFIILTTMGIALFERRTALGVMRCVGLTRGQLAGLLFVELVPLGLMGTAMGILLGIGVAQGVSFWAGDDLPRVFLSVWGINLAALSGIVTTLLAATMLVLQVGRVSPLTAVNPHVRPVRAGRLLYSGVVGVLLLGLHETLLATVGPQAWWKPGFTIAVALSLYLGYVLLTPALVVLLAPPMARIVGPLLGVNARIAVDQFGRSPWRSTGVCWILLVGLSLIVYLGIVGQAVLAVWDFPARLPETFVWSPDPVPGYVLNRVRDLPGVKEVTTSTDVLCEVTARRSVQTVEKRDTLFDMILRKLTRPVFVAGDPEGLLGMLKVAFIEGTEPEAKEKLTRGGYVLIPTQTAKHLSLHLGDAVTVTVQGRSADFEIAGVIQSPALDIAVTAFQATSYMQFAAASAMLGTREDLKEKFGLDVISMFMCNLDLPDSPIPPRFDHKNLPDPEKPREVALACLSWMDYLPSEAAATGAIHEPLRRWLESNDGNAAPPEIRAELSRYARAIARVRMQGDKQTKGEAWALLRERLVLLRIASEVDRPAAIIGSLRRLKQMVDESVHRSVTVITWLPSILLGVAVIGVANLMTVSVRIRARQIAVLRAVGALKSQVVRLVLAEAITLGLIGSVVGLALGFHQAYTDNRVTTELIGFHPEFIVPVGTVTLAVLLTVLVCLIAGIFPARHAARNNIIAAMQTM